jgi:predicted nucleotidyltransferase
MDNLHNQCRPTTSHLAIGVLMDQCNAEMVTPYSDVNCILYRVRTELRAVLGIKLVGLYLGGSLVSGSFNSFASDIDLTVALDSDVDDDEFHALKAMHTALEVRFPSWEDRIETCYVPLGALRNIRTDRRLIVNVSPGEPFHWTSLRKEWLVNWYELRMHGLTLFGPDPATFIQPISQQEFVGCLIAHARSWSQWIHHMRRRQQQAYAVLSMCRALYGIQHGRQVSKLQAASWAAEYLPEWSELIHAAVDRRQPPDSTSRS